MPSFFESIQNDWANFFDNAPYKPDVLNMISLGYARKDGQTIEELKQNGRNLPEGWEWMDPPGTNKTKTSSGEIESYIAVNHKQKKLRVIIPGTHNKYDLYKDYILLTQKKIYPKIAKRIIKNLVLTQQELCKSGTYYSTEILGHSLGGTVAELATMMLNTARAEVQLTNIYTNGRIPIPKDKKEKNLNKLVYGTKSESEKIKSECKKFLDSGSQISALCFDPAGVPQNQRTPLEQEISFFSNENCNNPTFIDSLRIFMAKITPDHSNILNIKTIPNVVSALNGSPGRTKIKVCPIIFDLIEWHLARIEAGKDSNEPATQTVEYAKKSAEQISKAFLNLHKMVTYGTTTKELLVTLNLYPTDDQVKQDQVDRHLGQSPPSRFYQISDDDWIEWSKNYSVWHETARDYLNTATSPSLLFSAAKTTYQLAAETHPAVLAGLALTSTAAAYFAGSTATQKVKESAKEWFHNTVRDVGTQVCNHSLFSQIKTGSFQTKNPCSRKNRGNRF